MKKGWGWKLLIFLFRVTTIAMIGAVIGLVGGIDKGADLRDGIIKCFYCICAAAVSEILAEIVERGVAE